MVYVILGWESEAYTVIGVYATADDAREWIARNAFIMTTNDAGDLDEECTSDYEWFVIRTCQLGREMNNQQQGERYDREGNKL